MKLPVPAVEARDVSVEDARRLILDCCTVQGPVDVALHDAEGFYLAEDIHTASPLPPFDSSAMDGFALSAAGSRSASVRSPLDLPVQTIIRAGEVSSETVSPDACARIMTGAPVPSGADAVIEKESVTETPDGIRLDRPVEPGRNVRPAGSDLEKGIRILEKGCFLTPGCVAAAAAAGRSTVRAYRKPMVGVISTGDELAPGGGPLAPGRIYDVNSPLILAFLRSERIPFEYVGRSGDSEVHLSALMGQALSSCDILIISGGISVGDFDTVRPALGKIGAQVIFSGVKQKPGKPFTFAVWGGELIFALPGNPAAVFVSLYEYIRPALLNMVGAPESARTPVSERAESRSTIRKKAGRVHFLRAKRDGGGVEVLPGQESYQVANFSEANALVVLPEDCTLIEKGQSVMVHPLPLPGIRSART